MSERSDGKLMLRVRVRIRARARARARARVRVRVRTWKDMATSFSLHAAKPGEWSQRVIM